VTVNPNGQKTVKDRICVRVADRRGRPRSLGRACRFISRTRISPPSGKRVCVFPRTEAATLLGRSGKAERVWPLAGRIAQTAAVTKLSALKRSISRVRRSLSGGQLFPRACRRRAQSAPELPFCADVGASRLRAAGARRAALLSARQHRHRRAVDCRLAGWYAQRHTRPGRHLRLRQRRILSTRTEAVPFGHSMVRRDGRSRATPPSAI
jgi:hypothetical protein